jgi:hypothetical protein
VELKFDLMMKMCVRAAVPVAGCKIDRFGGIKNEEWRSLLLLPFFFLLSVNQTNF